MEYDSLRMGSGHLPPGIPLPLDDPGFHITVYIKGNGTALTAAISC
jgi:hypothetical protein